jgi:DNA-directed RNA polymerase specialized sigma24 family protein
MGRRIVSDDEFKVALASRDNVDLVNSIITKYGFDNETRTEILMISIWTCLGYHDKNKGRKFTTNLHTWTHRICADYYKKFKRMKELPPLELGFNIVENDLAREAIDSLSEIERKIIVYKFQHKMPYYKIAEEVELTLEAVIGLSLMAREKLWCIINKGEKHG